MPEGPFLPHTHIPRDVPRVVRKIGFAFDKLLFIDFCQSMVTELVTCHSHCQQQDGNSGEKTGTAEGELS